MNRIGLLPTLHNILEEYEEMCKPFCKKMNIPQTAFDILMFLANNPEYPTAREIIKYRGIRPNLVSLYVDKLVNEGYLNREPMKGNRRCIKLTCTEQATPIIEAGQQMQEHFYEVLLEGIDQNDIKQFGEIIERCGKNITYAKEKRKNGELV